MMGGDIENNDGSGGESIYGGTFKSEGIAGLFGEATSGRGVVLTVPQGNYHQIGSQFLLCFKQDSHLEG
ncbi:putative peptidylprolyl isomerase [Helianthus debilis subsp. tardiflorus]